MQRSFLLTLLLIAVSFSVFAFPHQLRRGAPPDTPARRDATLKRMQRRHLEDMNRERFMRVKQNSEKLLELATQLHDEMDDADENILSVKVVRNAEDIEKLAKEIRERMSEHIGPGLE